MSRVPSVDAAGGRFGRTPTAGGQRGPEGPDGARFCREALQDVRRRAGAGRSCGAVLDVDNTLVDTRHRTLAVVRAFASLPGAPSRLHRARLDQMRFDGRQTAHALGLPPGAALALQTFWETAFWDAECFRHDMPIPETVALTNEAASAGAEIWYLTGRVRALQAGTVQQLRRLGLPCADAEHVICKPMPRVVAGQGLVFPPTAPFKVDRVSRLLGAGTHVAWFVSDSAVDIHALQRALPGVPCVWLDFPARPDRPAPAIAPDTPVLHVRL